MGKELKKNMPIGADVVAEAMAKNKTRSQNKDATDDKSPVVTGKVIDTPDKQPPVTNIKTTVPPKPTPEKETKGVVGAKGVKLQPVQAKLKPKLYATHQETIMNVNMLTDSNITSADIMRASVHLLSKMKPEKILEAIKETTI